MKFSEQWLREWVQPAITTETLVEQLTMAGLEVDHVQPVAGSFHGVVVGKVVATQPHPRADRLTLCDVVIAKENDPLAIVCGANNVRPDLMVAVATVGAQLPNGMHIKPTKLRGELSQGMLCSAQELELLETTTGILELADDAPIGQDVREYLQLDDVVIDIDLTPNRGDCLSVYGIAREVAAINHCDYQRFSIDAMVAAIDDQFPITVAEPAACGQYLGRVIRGINVTAITPQWMIERLVRSGIRAIHPVVDVTNYVMLELGQPMHAFDLNCLTGTIQVRMAQPNEQLSLLDGKQVTISPDTLVIADDEKPLALAGIMGGSDSAVTTKTTDIFLESAYFSPDIMAGKARSYNLSTESSHRFERGVAPSLQHQAMDRVTQLLLQIVGGTAGPITVIARPDYLPQSKTLLLRRNKLADLLGMTISDATVTNLLCSLGMRVAEAVDGWQVTVPPRRFDMTQEVDLIEEVVRIFGYNQLPNVPLKATLVAHPESELQISAQRFGTELVARGYHEVITYSFVDPALQQLITPQAEMMQLVNAISPESSTMRTSLWSGLLHTLQYNQCRQMSDMRLFETGLTFVKVQDTVQQTRKMAGLVSGMTALSSWDNSQRVIDYYDVKGDVESLLILTGCLQQFKFVAATHPALHPGQSAKIDRNGMVVGWLGMLHPGVAKQLDLNGSIGVFELDYEQLKTAELGVFQPFAKFPFIHRDLAFVIAADVEIQTIIAQLMALDDPILRDVIVFDVYQGVEIPAKHKSVAIRLTLQHDERTLQDSEIQTCVAGVIQCLSESFAVTLRE